MEQTFIVLGNMRGGTSVVAGLLRILGVNMGDNIDPYNHEDLDLQHRHPIHMRGLIDEKNAKYDTWGWKDPLAIDWIDGLFDLCDIRNPVVFVVFRDVVATTEGLMREEGWDARYAFEHATKQTRKLVEFVNNYRDKMMIVTLSYEKIVSHPEDITKFFASVVDVELTDDTLEKARQFICKGYKELTL